MKIRNTFIFILTLFCTYSCLPIDDSFYILPRQLENIPSDPNNPITQKKVYLGGSFFSWKGLSATGQVSCENCHDQDNNFEAPLRVDGTKVIGGCGEGFRLLEKGKNKGQLVAVIGYEGKDDCMPWVKSKAAENCAYEKVMGLSGRFGGTTDPQLRKDKIAHFGLNLSKELEDKLFTCEATLFQAFVALAGHRQFLLSRLLDNPELTKQLEDIFDTTINKRSDPNEVSFMIACTLDAFQRSFLRNDTKFQDYLRGEGSLTTMEYTGWQIFKDKCMGCHSSKVFSGGIEVSRFPDMEGVPDCANDITGVGIFLDRIYRKVSAPNPDLDFYGPHGEFTELDSYLEFHTDLDSIEIIAVDAWINTI